MENKEYATVKEMTYKLIGGWLLYGILFGIIYSLLYNLLTSSIDSLIIKAIIAIVLQGFTAYALWSFSTISAFKKKTIILDDVPKIMRNLIIFTIIVCIINGAYHISQVNSSIDKAVNSNYAIKNAETMMSYLYSDEQIIEYNKTKEETINKAKKQAYTYLVIIEIGLTIVYIAVLPLEKKELLKHINQGGELL